jgi:ubiquinone/menaquinone biosynthesis C-methylase UbiE
VVSAWTVCKRRPRSRPAFGDTTVNQTVEPVGSRQDRAKQQAQGQFEKWALSYDRSRLNEVIFYPCIRACQEEILRWQQQRGAQGYSLLDVGCGTGTLLAVLSHDPYARRLVGLDYAQGMVDRADEKLKQLDTRIDHQVVQGDAEHLPFEDASFDVLACCNSFHHYPDQLAAVRGFARVLKPGGLLLLLDGFRDNVIGWFVFDVVVETIEKHVHHAAWTEVRTMLSNAGFREIRQRKMNVFAPVLVNVALR